MDIKSAIDRLNSQLPLKAKQNTLPRSLKTVHQRMLYSLVKQGRPLSHDELAQQLVEDNIEPGLHTLASEDLIVLDKESKQPVGAYPVTVEQTSHKITVNGHNIYAMCALDAVSVAPMFDTEVQIESSCKVTRTPISIRMRGKEILHAQPSAAVTVGIRWQMPTDVAAHSMCMEMVFLKDRHVAESWQGNDSENLSLFTLPEAVEFGSGFFQPLLS